MNQIIIKFRPFDTTILPSRILNWPWKLEALLIVCNDLNIR